MKTEFKNALMITFVKQNLINWMWIKLGLVPILVLLSLSVSGQMLREKSEAERLKEGPPSVGMEGQVEITAPAPQLKTVPMSNTNALFLRIAETWPHGEGFRYDLRYIGMEPGTYDLRDWLRTVNGDPAELDESIEVEVISVLPEDHQGEVEETPLTEPPFLGGYWRRLSGAGLIWAGLGLALLTVWLRNRPTRAPITEKTQPHSMADRLRPLVIRASEGDLSDSEKAELERTLLGYWKQELGLEQLDPRESLRQLKQHEQAGALLRALEDWLHRPPGQVPNVEVETLLEPYRNLPSPKK